MAATSFPPAPGREAGDATSLLRLRAALSVAGAGALAATGGAVVLYGYGALVAASSIPMWAADPWAAEAQAVAPANFALGTVVCTFWGTVLAIVLTRWAARPARFFVRAAIVLVALSLVAPLAAVDTAFSTRIALAGGHLLAAVIVVPILARSLARRPVR